MSSHGPATKNNKQPQTSPKYIFVSGGVLSGLGKGITAASIGVLLQSHGYKVTNIKCENYLNLDSGNINPIEHGDVFLCEDGLEADLDLGTYERFLGHEVGKKNFTTIGQVYQHVIAKTRDLHYNGATVDAIPYVPEEVIRRIKDTAKGHDFILVELGGTAGEYQNVVYYEAYRILKLRQPHDVLHIHVTYFPKPPHIGELKSKPTQLSVKILNEMGIQPDMLIARAEDMIDDKRKEKVAFYCNLDKRDVISNPDSRSVYEIPLIFKEQDLDKRILEKLTMPSKRAAMTQWKQLVDRIVSPKNTSVRVGVIAKYIATGNDELIDSYKSLVEALNHASWKHEFNLDIVFINAEAIEKNDQAALKELQSVDGIIVPIGWGQRGVEGKIKAVQYAREKKVPYLGLCYGMQLASIEFARTVVGLTDADTTENVPHTPHPIIHDIPFDARYQTIKGDVASMRLGAYDCVLKEGTLAHAIYTKHNAFEDKRKNLISERHRHRFEFNNAYREQLEAKGFVISGTSPDDFFVEVIELNQKDHPFFIATQAHPEYKSFPLKPHPIFMEYLDAVAQHAKKK